MSISKAGRDSQAMLRASSSVSRLKWHAGFGWGTATTVVATVATAVLVPGIIRGLALTAALLAGTFAFVQYRSYNAKGWPQVHNRAMLRLASLAAAEKNRAKGDGRPVDPAAAPRELAAETLGLKAEEFLGALEADTGDYLSALLERHREDVLPGADDDRLLEVLGGLGQVGFGPQSVVCKIVESNFGSLEAARYVLALIQGRAR